MILCKMCIRDRDNTCLYVNVNNLFIVNDGLFHFVEHFYKLGGKVLLLDQAHNCLLYTSFTSKAVEEVIAGTKKKLKDPKLAWMFENCFPNTLDTTVNFKMIDGKPDTFVITGDIDAMWLRDSGAQVWPYVALCKKMCIRDRC